MAPARGILVWVPHEIESCNFQNLLVFDFLKPLKIGYHLDNFYFQYFKGVTLKKSKKPRNLPKWPQTGAKMIWSFLAMQTFSEIQKEPKVESNEDGGKYVEIVKGPSI